MTGTLNWLIDWGSALVSLVLIAIVLALAGDVIVVAGITGGVSLGMILERWLRHMATQDAEVRS